MKVRLDEPPGVPGRTCVPGGSSSRCVVGGEVPVGLAPSDWVMKVCPDEPVASRAGRFASRWRFGPVAPEARWFGCAVADGGQAEARHLSREAARPFSGAWIHPGTIGRKAPERSRFRRYGPDPLPPECYRPLPQRPRLGRSGALWPMLGRLKPATPRERPRAHFQVPGSSRTPPQPHPPLGCSLADGGQAEARPLARGAARCVSGAWIHPGTIGRKAFERSRFKRYGPDPLPTRSGTGPCRSTGREVHACALDHLTARAEATSGPRGMAQAAVAT